MCFWMQEVSLKSDLYVSCLHAWQNMKNYSDKLFWMLHRPLITHYIKLKHCNIIIAIRDKLSIILSTFPWQSLTNKLTFDPFCLMRLCSPGISWKIITLHYIIDLCDRSHSYTLVLILTNSAMTTENLKNVPKHHRFFFKQTFPAILRFQDHKLKTDLRWHGTPLWFTYTGYPIGITIKSSMFY